MQFEARSEPQLAILVSRFNQYDRIMVWLGFVFYVNYGRLAEDFCRN